MEYDLEIGSGSNREWATVEEAAQHFRRSIWFIRKTANEMVRLRVERHPIKAGRDWLIDISGMTSFFAAKAVQTSATTTYPIAQASDSLPDEIGPDETWELNTDVA